MPACSGADWQRASRAECSCRATMVAWLERLTNLASSVRTEVWSPELSHPRDDATRFGMGIEDAYAAMSWTTRHPAETPDTDPCTPRPVGWRNGIVKGVRIRHPVPVCTTGLPPPWRRGSRGLGVPAADCGSHASTVPGIAHQVGQGVGNSVHHSLVQFRLLAGDLESDLLPQRLSGVVHQFVQSG